MSCHAEVQQNYDAPVLAGTFRFLLGLTMVVIGLYIATLTDVQGHGFGLLLVLGSPFVILKDKDKSVST